MPFLGCVGKATTYHLTGQSFPMSGTFNRPADFKSPSGVVGKVRAQCWSGSGGSQTAGGGAGAGAYSEGEVTPGPTETVTVATDVAANTNGGDTSFGSLVLAERGRAGGSGEGGDAADGVGTTRHDGGDGSTGGSTRGGGGGAGSQASGTSASGSTAGIPGAPDGGYSQLPGTASGWPGGAPGSTAGASQGGRGGVCCTLYRAPSLAKAPRVRSFSKNRSTANGTTHSCNAPTDRDAGNLLVLITSADGNPTIDEPTWKDGGLVQITQSGNAVCGRAFFREATGDANDNASNITTTASEHVSSVMLCIEDAGGDPEWTTAQGNAANPDPPVHSNTFGSRPTLYVVIAGLDGSAGPAISGLPTGYGPLVFVPGFDPNGTLLAVTWLQNTATSENPGPWGATNEQHWVATMAIPGT